MRIVAPTRLGTAMSQNCWLRVSAKPAAGRSGTTTRPQGPDAEPEELGEDGEAEVAARDAAAGGLPEAWRPRGPSARSSDRDASRGRWRPGPGGGGRRGGSGGSRSGRGRGGGGGLHGSRPCPRRCFRALGPCKSSVTLRPHSRAAGHCEKRAASQVGRGDAPARRGSAGAPTGAARPPTPRGARARPPARRARRRPDSPART